MYELNDIFCAVVFVILCCSVLCILIMDHNGLQQLLIDKDMLFFFHDETPSDGVIITRNLELFLKLKKSALSATVQNKFIKWQI